MRAQFHYKGIREQLISIADYVVILEKSATVNPCQHLTMLVSLIEYLKKQLEIYLKYEMFKEAKKYDRNN